jgi:1-deoxyxylulose-5-phosphate synthase
MGMTFIAWSPLARGLLSEKYLNASHIVKGDRLLDEGIMKESLNDDNKQKLGRLSALAHQWDMKLSQLALSYMLSIPGMGPVIPASSTILQLELNVIAAKIKVTEDPKRQIRKALGQVEEGNVERRQN